MKKLIALGILLTAGLAAMFSFTSCGKSSEDELTILASLIDNRPVYLFEVSSSQAGNITTSSSSARLELDGLAKLAYNASYSDLGCTKIHAFISISDSDRINNLGIPAWGQILSPTDNVIAENLADLLDGDISIALWDAGVATDIYWTGATSNGGAKTDTCNSWTNGTSGSNGGTGNYYNTNSTWLESNNLACNGTYSLLGVCW